MLFEFSNEDGPVFLESFAESLGTVIKNGTINIPQSLGTGYIRMVDLGILKLMLNCFTLREELIIRRLSSKHKRGIIILTFQHIFHRMPAEKQKTLYLLPSVRISSNDLAMDSLFPAHNEINSITIAIHADAIKNMLHTNEKHQLLDAILDGQQPFIYEELISPDIQEVSAEIIQADAPKLLQPFYYRLKAEQLIYLLFAELLKRSDQNAYSINVEDIKAVYAVRDRIVEDLSLPPNLGALAKFSGMSESKLKRIFRQVFGDSIYNYYQTLRMKEAAYLIKDKKLSVSEAGYQLGFSNLSHFTRLFEKHLGVKPKKFSLQ